MSDKPLDGEILTGSEITVVRGKKMSALTTCNLYLYRMEGYKIYWGRMHGVGRWTFRRKAVKIDRWYISGGVMFRVYVIPASKYNGFGIMAEIRFGNKTVHVGLDDKICLGINPAEDTFYPIHQSTKTQRDDFRRMFINRLVEYDMSYFVPMEKGLKNVV